MVVGFVFSLLFAENIKETKKSGISISERLIEAFKHPAIGQHENERNNDVWLKCCFILT